MHYLLGDAAAELGAEIGRVVTLDKLTYAGNRASLADLEADPRHVFVQGDIGDGELVAGLLREHAIDAVMHLAAESHVDRSIDNPEEFIMTNFVGTYRLLEAFRKHAVETGRMDDPELRFLHVSTDEVYGSLGPDDPHTYGLPVVTTNCSNNYGPYQFPEKLLPLMIRKTLKGEPLPVYGDGSNIRDWLVIGGKCEMRNIDVVRAIIGTVRELAPDKVTRSDEELITYVKDRPGHDRRYAIDPARIENELGWHPRENFASGLRRTGQLSR